MSERNEDEPGQGYAAGYTHGFWSGAAVGVFSTIILLAIVGTYVN